MLSKKYSNTHLKEYHGDEIGILGTGIEILPEVIGIQSINFSTISEKKREKLGAYGLSELWRAMIVEFCSCIVLMLIENYCQGNLQIAIFGNLILVAILYPVSGANMNACMSLALWYYEQEFVKIHIIRRFGYMLFVQPLGLFVGQMLSWGVIGPDLIYLKPRDTEPLKIAFCEFFWTGAFIFATLHMIVSRYTRPSSQLGVNFILFICMLYFVLSAGSKISGSSYNPTKYLVNQAIAYYRGIEPNAFQNWYCYVFPQFIGTAVFTLIFQNFFEPTYYKLISLKMSWEDTFFPEKYEK